MSDKIIDLLYIRKTFHVDGRNPNKRTAPYLKRADNDIRTIPERLLDALYRTIKILLKRLIILLKSQFMDDFFFLLLLFRSNEPTE